MKRSHRRAASRKGQHFRQRWGKGSQAGNGVSAVCTRPDESTHLDRMQRDAGQGARPPLLGACLPAKSLQSCRTLCDPMNCQPGSSVHGILQVRVLEWDAMPSFRGSSKPWIKPASLMAPALSSSFFIISATWEAHNTCDFTFNILFYNVIMHLGCGGPSLLNGRFLPLPGVRVPL